MESAFWQTVFALSLFSLLIATWALVLALCCRGEYLEDDTL